MAIETYKLADGSTRYKAVAYLEDKTKKSKRGFKTKKAAKKWIAETQVLGLPKPNSELTYGEVVDKWAEVYKPTVKPSTFGTSITEIRSSFKYIPESTLISSITTNDILRLSQAFSVEYCNSKIRLNKVKMVFNFAEVEDIISDNPFRKLKKPKQKKKGKEYPLWTTENLKDFLTACRSYKNPMVYPAFRLLAYTGLRNGELTALKWSDLDGNLLTIQRTITKDYNFHFIMGEDAKTDESCRTIAIDSETLGVILEWKKVCPSKDRMFPCSPNTIRYWMDAILSQNPGIPPSTPHKLRHLHCTILLDAKANLKDVQERMGHADAQTTLNVYAHANPNKSLVADIFTNALNDTTI